MGWRGVRARLHARMLQRDTAQPDKDPQLTGQEVDAIVRVRTNLALAHVAPMAEH